jgi:hypothetical protein
MAPSNWFTELLLILERDPDKCDPHDPLRVKLAAWKEKWFTREQRAGTPWPCLKDYAWIASKENQLREEGVSLIEVVDIPPGPPTTEGLDTAHTSKERQSADVFTDSVGPLAKPPIKRKKGKR